MTTRTFTGYRPHQPGLPAGRTDFTLPDWARGTGSIAGPRPGTSCFQVWQHQDGSLYAVEVDSAHHVTRAIKADDWYGARKAHTLDWPTFNPMTARVAIGYYEGRNPQATRDAAKWVEDHHHEFAVVEFTAQLSTHPHDEGMDRWIVKPSQDTLRSSELEWRGA